MKDIPMTRERGFLMQRLGSISQMAGIRRCELLDGKAKGVEAAEFRTGTGFEFTVLPGRGMDIAWAGYRGVPISYITKNGVVSPNYYECGGMGWLRSFFAGMLTTCGLSNVGGPCCEDDPILGTMEYGLHGRISNTCAEDVSFSQGWQGDDFQMSVAGTMRESILHGENLTLRREVSSALGLSRLNIRDTVENNGFSEKPLMILYHINVGYPVLDSGARFVSSSSQIQPNDELSRANMVQYDRMKEPESGAKENLYFHSLNGDKAGDTYTAVINDRLELGVYAKFNLGQLPRFAEWKMMSAPEYVLGIEPSNCLPIGREEQRRRGGLQLIQPGEKRTFDLEIGVLEDLRQIEDFEEKIRTLG